MNKKSHFLVFVSILFFAFSAFSSSAQDQPTQWKWLNWWRGTNADDALRNKVYCSAFDEDGNIYVYGSVGGMPEVQENGQIYSLQGNSNSGPFLAKFDTLGNMLWYKVVQQSYYRLLPYGMVIHGDQITIAGDYMLTGNSTVFYFDTLIPYNQVMFNMPHSDWYPPFSPGYFTFFVTFDANGNKLSEYFVQIQEKMNDGTSTLPLHNGTMGGAHVDIDSEGNLFLTANYAYGNITADDSLFIVVYGDTITTYNISHILPVSNHHIPFNSFIYKFSPTMDLLDFRLFVDHTEGIYDTSHPHLIPSVYDIEIDNEDNLYLVGYFTELYYADSLCYPVRIYYDDSHYALVEDVTMTTSLPFIVKYNSFGNVLWSNQLYGRGNPILSGYFTWTNMCMDNDNVYVFGSAGTIDNMILYFDNESNAFPTPMSTKGYYVSFNKQTGRFVHYDVISDSNTTSTIDVNARPTVINDHLLCISKFYDGPNSYLFSWQKNVEYKGVIDTIFHPLGTGNAPGGVIIDNNGNMLLDISANSDLDFGNGIELNRYGNTKRHAVLAYGKNTSLTVPYSSVGIEEYEQRERKVTLFPNPTDGLLNIQSTDGAEINGVEIVDMFGKTLKTFSIGDASVSLSVKDLPAGMYIARITTQQGVSTMKFVKAN